MIQLDLHRKIYKKSNAIYVSIYTFASIIVDEMRKLAMAFVSFALLIRHAFEENVVVHLRYIVTAHNISAFR